MSAAPPGVAAIAEAVARREVSAVDVIGDHLRRAAAIQPTLNAFTLIDNDGALAAATAVDEQIAAGYEPGPLAGVPVAIKDLIDQAGLPNTAGSSYPPPLPRRSASAVARLEAAGAVMIGRTGLHEYAFGFSSENHWFGPVRSPWDPRLSPGGSSGGSAVAVASGAAAAALGTDTGGSVRVPAALCGVVGLKVTHGRVPLSGVFPLAPSLDTVGPLARSVGDAALIYHAIAGYDPADPWSSPRPVTPPSGGLSLRDVTIGIPHPWVDLPQTEQVAAAFATAREVLSKTGVNLVDLKLPDLRPSPDIEDSVYPEVAVVHRDRWQSHRDTYGPDVSRRMTKAFDIDLTAYVHALQWRAQMRHTTMAALSECDVLMTPAVAAAAKPIGEEQIAVAGKMVSYRPQLSRYSALVNHTGLPAIALPLDMDGTPPPSVQLIAAPWQEHRLLDMGAAFEQISLSRYRTPPHGTRR